MKKDSSAYVAWFLNDDTFSACFMAPLFLAYASGSKSCEVQSLCTIVVVQTPFFCCTFAGNFSDV
jgi:hypothetical protein